MTLRNRARPALVEIVERRHNTTSQAEVDRMTGGGYIKPNEVRINGTPVAVPRDSEIFVSELKSENDAVQVSMTMFARRVVVAAEPGGAPTADTWPETVPAPPPCHCQNPEAEHPLGDTAFCDYRVHRVAAGVA